MKLIVLDRDGTINHDSDQYIKSPLEWKPIAGSLEAIARLTHAGWRVVVATNQSGIARGFLTEQDYEEVANRTEQLLAEGGARVDVTYMCPHYPPVTGPCECRKPGTLHYRMAAERFGLDLSASWWIGDRLTDVEPADRLGGRGILLGNAPAPPPHGNAPDLATAAATILQ